MTSISATAYAKINLALHIRRRRPDGYHEIETLFAFAEAGDLLGLEPSDRWSLEIAGEFAAGLDGTQDDNLVLRAARMFASVTGAPGGGRFVLDKRLPIAAGIGGGSADAAAALRLLATTQGLPTDGQALLDIAGRLGADVPACVVSHPVRGESRGDLLSPIAAEHLAGVPLLLVNPRRPLATGPVFVGWDGVDRGALPPGDPLDVALAGRNDLAPPAIALLPVIGDVVARLAKQPGVRLARMSGSGATCFALFDSLGARDAADAAIAAEEPGWWRLATRLRAISP